ncbi:MAG: hypothetical protein LAO08_19120 [Acidobacteriia bacterium]|nr:hypothetical protein [Terriglobia bacterium]
MKVKLANGKGEVFNLENNTARVLIAAGTLVEYVAPTKPPRIGITSWKAVIKPGIRFEKESYIEPTPTIVASCSMCGGAVTLTGRNAHKTQHFLHCGLDECVPADIARQYEGLYESLKQKEKTREQSAEVQKPHFIDIF